MAVCPAPVPVPAAFIGTDARPKVPVAGGVAHARAASHSARGILGHGRFRAAGRLRVAGRLAVWVAGRFTVWVGGRVAGRFACGVAVGHAADAVWCGGGGLGPG